MFIVTGGAGFIGSAMVARLNQEGINDIIIVDNINTSEKWQNLLGKSFTDVVHKDLFLDKLISGSYRGKSSCIIHMGACSTTTEHDFDYLLENNFRYSVKLAEHCRENNIRYIYASSAATYGDGSLGYSDSDDVSPTLRPLNRYGYSKQLFDQWVIQNGYLEDAAGLKFFNVYGPNEYHKLGQMSMVPQAYHQIKKTGKVKLFKSYRDDYPDGEQKRDFVYVKDCTDVMWWLVENEETNGIFNIGVGKARSWNDLANATFSALGIDPQIEYIDMPEVLQGQYQYFTEAKMDKLKKAGYTAPFRTLEEGIQDYVQNYLERPIPFL